MWVVRSRMCSLRTSARTSSLPCSSLDLFSRISPRRWLCRLILSLFSWCRLALRCSRCPSSWERNNSSLPKVKKKKQQICIFIVQHFLLKEQSRKTSHSSSMWLIHVYALFSRDLFCCDTHHSSLLHCRYRWPLWVAGFSSCMTWFSTSVLNKYKTFLKTGFYNLLTLKSSTNQICTKILTSWSAWTFLSMALMTLKQNENYIIICT